MKTFLFICVLFCFIYLAQSRVLVRQRFDNANIDCKTCQHVMKIIWLEKLKQNNDLKAIHRKVVEGFKNTPFHTKQRDDYTTFEVNILLKTLNKVKDPKKVCELLRKCPEPTTPDSLQCDFCVDTVNIIKAELAISNATIQAIIDIIKALCSVSIKPVKEECDVILDAINDIIMWLEEHIDPKDICIRLGICPNDTVSTKLNEQKSRMCRAIDRGVKMLNEKVGNEKRMDEKLKQVCGHLGANEQQCQHVKATIKAFLATGEGLLNICGRNNNMTPLVVKGNSTVFCDLCKMVMESVGTILNDVENGLENVQKALDGLCDDVEEVKTQCKYVVDLVMEDLERNIEFMKGSLDPEITCEAFKLCSQSLIN